MIENIDSVIYTVNFIIPGYIILKVVSVILPTTKQSETETIVQSIGYSILNNFRKAFYEARRLEIGKILRDLCEWKGVNIIEAEVCPDHIHMLIEIPPKMSVSGFMGFLKGKSSQMIYEKWANARYIWCRGYYVDAVGKNTKKIQEYIQSQLKEDKVAEQLQLEFEDPFTGNKK